MNEPLKSRWAALALVVVILFSGSVSGQPPTVSVVPKTTGPVGIAELHALLDVHLQFEILEFEAEDRFCLVLGYEHEVEGHGTSRGRHNEVACGLAGPYRLIVVMRPVGDKMRLLFGLHGRDTGMGSTRIVADLPIPLAIGSATFYGAERLIHSDTETTLFRWQFGRNAPRPGPRHHVRVLVRLDENDLASGIGSYSKPNDFGQ